MQSFSDQDRRRRSGLEYWKSGTHDFSCIIDFYVFLTVSFQAAICFSMHGFLDRSDGVDSLLELYIPFLLSSDLSQCNIASSSRRSG